MIMRSYVAPKIEVVELEEEVGALTIGGCCDIKVDDGGTLFPGPQDGGFVNCDNPLNDWGGD